MTKRTIFSLVLIITILISSIAYAEVEPRADILFNEATINLRSDQSVLFSFSLYEVKTKLSVLTCWLEQEIDGEWEYACALASPSAEFLNTFAYMATMDYSSEIGTGTFRVWATFNADGYEITRCSNERTFN